MMIKNIILFFLLALACSSCDQKKNNAATSNKQSGKKVTLKYTSIFSITQFNDFKKVVVQNPWDSTKVYASYVLVPKNKELPKGLSKDDVLIRTPVEKMVLLASPHIGLYNALSATDKITAVSRAEHIYNKKVLERIKEGDILEVGADQSLNIEFLIDLKPEMLMATGNQHIHDNLKLAQDYGIPIVYNIEWQEQSALARAEWIKFAATFLDKDKEAQEIFDSIEKSYLEAIEIVKDVTQKPKVILGKKYKGTWYMSGGKGYFAGLLRDAGAAYYWNSYQETGSLPLSFEEVLDKQMDTDVWINPGAATSISQLLKEDNRYGHFKPLKEKNIYTFSRRINSTGANAYWESGPISPHLILSDLIKILHPDLLPDHDFVYFMKLPDENPS